MRPLSDETVRHLRRVTNEPDLAGGRYEMVDRIARGGMGTVYRVRDLALDREVALKVVSLPDPDPETLARITREARILARLEHPGIVPVHDVGTLPDGRIFYTMKLVRGSRLDEYLNEARPLDDRLRIFTRICEAVSFAHAHGVVHRDLKPENVMVGPFGEVLVMDWGVAKLLGEAGVKAGRATRGERSKRAADERTSVEGEWAPLGDGMGAPGVETAGTAPGTVLGTPGYMAPEQAAGRAESVDQRADIFALGMILRFLCRGARTSEASGRAPMSDPRAVPKPLAAVMGKATAPAASLRYTDAEELASEVRRFQAALPVAAYRERLHDRARRIFGKYRTPILLVLAYLLMRVSLLALAQR